MAATRRSMLMSSIALFAAPLAARAQNQAASSASSAPAAAPAAKPGSPDVVAGIPVNYNESKVGDYVLPDPLTAADGTRITTAKAWMSKRRPEIVKLFEEQQYGRAPAKPAALAFEVQDTGTPAFSGKAMRKQVKITFTRDKSGPSIQLLIYTPAAAKTPVPLLLVMGWGANGAAVDDPGVVSNPVWSPKEKKRNPYVAVPGARGFGRLNVQPILDAGLGVATFNYGDVDPDDLDAIQGGIRALYLKPGATLPAPDEWGSIAAWGWGISRVIDYFETDKAVDAKRIAIHGVSRLGKTVMWAGAHDTRVAATIASCSGEGGAAVSRRNYGETIAHLTAPSRYPYQFAINYAKWGGFPDKAPMDGNLLVALHAPRPLLLQTGTTDNWSDPKGEWVAAVDAGKVYKLLGKQDLGTDVWPAANAPILHDLSYLMHEGGHGTLPSDWPVYIDFLKMHLKPEA